MDDKININKISRFWWLCYIGAVSFTLAWMACVCMLSQCASGIETLWKTLEKFITLLLTFATVDDTAFWIWDFSFACLPVAPAFFLIRSVVSFFSRCLLLLGACHFDVARESSNILSFWWPMYHTLIHIHTAKKWILKLKFTSSCLIYR